MRFSEVGRSVQTPQLGQTLADESSDHNYKVVLAIPENFQNEIGNWSLVIELIVDMKKEDEHTLYLSFLVHHHTF